MTGYNLADQFIVYAGENPSEQLGIYGLGNGYNRKEVTLELNNFVTSEKGEIWFKVTNIGGQNNSQAKVTVNCRVQ